MADEMIRIAGRYEGENGIGLAKAIKVDEQGNIARDARIVYLGGADDLTIAPGESIVIPIGSQPYNVDVSYYRYFFFHIKPNGMSDYKLSQIMITAGKGALQSKKDLVEFNSSGNKVTGYFNVMSLETRFEVTNLTDEEYTNVEIQAIGVK